MRNNNRKKNTGISFLILSLSCLIVIMGLYLLQKPEEQTKVSPEKGVSSPLQIHSYLRKKCTYITTNIKNRIEEEAMKEESIPTDRTIYKEGFYYEPLSEEIKQKITGISYQENPHITYDNLRYVSVLYVDFQGNTQTGELICNQSIAEDLVEIFSQLYNAAYPIEKIKLIDDYNGDDDLSCDDNNTSCFNYRVVAGTDSLSKHALGLAIDINPFYNPYITYPNGIERISPKGSEPYADRDSGLPYMILKDDLCYRLFIERGFTWGGEWNTLKDYQHFQKNP